jgi:heat shock protein HslJ
MARDKMLGRLQKIWIPGVLVILVALSGCSKTQQVLVREREAPPATLEGRWDLKSYGPVGSERTIAAENPITLVFEADGKISGSGGCNRYFGGWGFLEGSTDTVRIWRTGSTRMACPEPIMVQEHRFLEELSRASRYQVEAAELRLYYDEGRAVLRFSRGVTP